MSNKKVVKLPFPYAWMILAVLFIGMLASFGARASFGAFISSWEKEFSLSRTVITSISMLSFIVFAFAQPIVGKMNDQWGGRVVPSASILLVGVSLLLTSQATNIWQIFFLFGVVFSTGLAGCSNVIASSIITKWFKKKTGFALGLAVSGMAVGQLVVVPSSLFLINQYNWRVALLVVGIVILVVAVPLMFIFVRSKPEEAGMLPYGYSQDNQNDQVQLDNQNNNNHNLSLFSVMKQKVFWLLVIPYFVCGFTDVGLVQTHLIPMTEGKGFLVSFAALAFSLIAVFNIVGTIATGYMSDHFNRSRQLGVIYAARALMLVLLLITNNPWLLVPFAIIYGATEMASIAPTASLTVELFDKYSIGAILGFVSISHQLGGAVGSWIPGIMYDLTGSYNSILILSIALLVGAALMTVRVPDSRIQVKTGIKL